MINLLSNDLWSESDIVAYGRAVIASQVSEARQNELRTIMLGHIAQMRTATPEELAEIALVQQVTEAQVLINQQARADVALLAGVMAYEGALERLALPAVTEPATVEQTDLDGTVQTIPNPAIALDAEDRALAQSVVDAATGNVLALHALRHPVVAAVEV